MEEAVAEIHGDYVTPGKPTFYPYKDNCQPDLLDFFVYKNISLNNKTCCNVIDKCKVDHVPVTMTIFTNPVLINKLPSLYSK